MTSVIGVVYGCIPSYGMYCHSYTIPIQNPSPAPSKHLKVKVEICVATDFHLDPLLSQHVGHVRTARSAWSAKHRQQNDRQMLPSVSLPRGRMFGEPLHMQQMLAWQENTVDGMNGNMLIVKWKLHGKSFCVEAQLWTKWDDGIKHGLGRYMKIPSQFVQRKLHSK